MKAIILASALLLPFLGSAVAGSGSSTDESTATINLAQYVPGAPIIYILCANHTTLANCQNPTFWQESNKLGGLQHLGLQGSANYGADAKLLP